MAPCCACTRCLLLTQENMCAEWREGLCLWRALSWSPLSPQALVSSHVGKQIELDITHIHKHKQRLLTAAMAGPGGDTAYCTSISPGIPASQHTPISQLLETNTLPSVASIWGHPSSPNRVIFLPCVGRAEPGSELPCCWADSPPDLLAQAWGQPPCPTSGRRWEAKDEPKDPS